MSDTSRPETPDETWARLQAGNNTSPSQVQPGRAFKRRRFGPGYEVASVDAFVATIGQRSAAEIKDARFPYTRFGGYDVKEVDSYLEDVMEQRRRQHR